MTPELKTLLIVRLKAFGWRLVCIVGALVLTFLAEQIKLFALPTLVSSILGVLIADGTAWFNAHQGMMGKTFLGRSR